MEAAVFTRDDDGNVTNPPILPEWEARINRAALTGSDEEVARVQEGYNDARDDEVKRIEADAKKRPASDDDGGSAAPKAKRTTTKRGGK